jgi:hypothetical protein
MPKKIKHLEVLENEIIEEPKKIEDENDIETIDEEILEPPPNPTKSKPKRVLTDAQKEALAKGRERGWEKLKQKHQQANKKKEVVQKIKQIKEETNVKEIEDLKKIADVSQVHSKVEKLNEKFNDIDNKITELLELKKKKLDNKYQNEIQAQIKNQAREMVVKKSMSNYSSGWERK